MRQIKVAALTTALLLAMVSSCLAFSQTIGVPPGTVSVRIITSGVNTKTGRIVFLTETNYCPATSTITVTQPNNTGDVNYVSAVAFSDVNGTQISVVEVIQGDGSGAPAGGNGGSGGRPSQTVPDP